MTDKIETLHQIALFDWAKRREWEFPELDTMFHIPNEGKRSKREGAEQKAKGLKSGVSDICLPVPRGKYGSLWIELKTDSGKESDEQKWWKKRMLEVGNYATVCREWTVAAKIIEKYLKGEIQRDS